MSSIFRYVPGMVLLVALAGCNRSSIRPWIPPTRRIETPAQMPLPAWYETPPTQYRDDDPRALGASPKCCPPHRLEIERVEREIAREEDYLRWLRVIRAALKWSAKEHCDYKEA